MPDAPPPGGRIDVVFHAVGDPTRREILRRLSHRPASVSSLAAGLGVTLTAIAQHLRVLEAAGLARTEKVGRVRTCSIDQAGFTVLEQWIAEHRSLWRNRLDRLADLLDEPGGEGA